MCNYEYVSVNVHHWMPLWILGRPYSVTVPSVPMYTIRLPSFSAQDLGAHGKLLS